MSRSQCRTQASIERPHPWHWHDLAIHPRSQQHLPKTQRLPSSCRFKARAEHRDTAPLPASDLVMGT